MNLKSNTLSFKSNASYRIEYTKKDLMNTHHFNVTETKGNRTMCPSCSVTSVLFTTFIIKRTSRQMRNSELQRKPLKNMQNTLLRNHAERTGRDLI